MIYWRFVYFPGISIPFLVSSRLNAESKDKSVMTNCTELGALSGVAITIYARVMDIPYPLYAYSKRHGAFVYVRDYEDFLDKEEDFFNE